MRHRPRSVCPVRHCGLSIALNRDGTAPKHDRLFWPGDEAVEEWMVLGRNRGTIVCEGSGRPAPIPDWLRDLQP